MPYDGMSLTVKRGIYKFKQLYECAIRRVMELLHLRVLVR
jgi:hypothetical protein